MIIVGSYAASYRGIERRDPKDIDIWIAEEESYTIGENEDVATMPEEVINMVNVDGNCFADPDSLFTIKCSHFQWDVHWEKTKLDIIHMKSKGCKIIPELYYALIGCWKKEHGDKSYLSLNQSKKDFFTDKVKYIYDHDYLHELVAYPNKPVYTLCLKDGEEILIDRDKFIMLPEDQQIQMFKEEITVIALERWLLNPYNKERLSCLQAYKASLKKTIISLTKGWASDFIIFNLDKFINPDYKMFKHALETLGGNKMTDKTKLEELKEALQYTASDDNFALELASGEDWYIYRDSKVLDDITGEGKREKLRDILNSFGYEHIEQEGGGEGGSEYCYGVFKLGDQIFKTNWSYYSHHGDDEDGAWYSLCEVTPKQKTITVYE